MTKLLFNLIAIRIGHGETDLLKQLFYWLDRITHILPDGNNYIYNTLEEWTNDENCPYHSTKTIQRYFNKMETLGLVVIKKAKGKTWYRVDMEVYNNMFKEEIERASKKLQEQQDKKSNKLSTEEDKMSNDKQDKQDKLSNSISINTKTINTNKRDISINQSYRLEEDTKEPVTKISVSENKVINLEEVNSITTQIDFQKIQDEVEYSDGSKLDVNGLKEVQKNVTLTVSFIMQSQDKLIKSLVSDISTQNVIDTIHRIADQEQKGTYIRNRTAYFKTTLVSVLRDTQSHFNSKGIKLPTNIQNMPYNQSYGNYNNNKKETFRNFEEREEAKTEEYYKDCFANDF